jgi:RNA polymerase sigma factor (sigma-70 family)
VEQDEVAETVRRAAAGDESAWSAIVESFSSLVWSVGLRAGLSRADAGEVVQMTFLRLVENLGKLREPEALGGWLATTARREAWRIGRAAGKEIPAEATPEVEEPDPGPEERAVASDRAREVRHAFARLPERCARLLELVVVLALPYVQVSAILDLPVGSIGPTRARCLERLRGLLPEGHDD